MKRNRLIFLILCLSVLATVGCASWTQKNILYPAHDEVLIYKLPYDLTYLRTLDALSSFPGWELDMTEKEKGIIQVRNLDWAKLNDSDTRTVSFWIKRVNRQETSVQVAPKSQHTLGAGKLLERINQYVSAEL